MASRRRFLSTVGIAAGSALLPGQRFAAATHAETQSTWLTYAVNIEMTWTNLPYLDRIRKVKEAGFTHYEFWPWANKDLTKIAELNRELGLTTAQFSASPARGFGHGITDPSPERRDEFVTEIEGAITAAKQLNVKKICVVAGEMKQGYSRDEQTRAVIQCLKAGAVKAAAAGVTIILEPLNILVDHPRQLIVHSEQAAFVLNAVGSPNVKMLFDIYHQQISEGNLTGNIRRYHDLIGYYQMADHPGRHEPFTGEINYPFVLKTIHDVGYRGVIGMELSAKKDPTMAFQAVRKADTMARELSERA